MNVIMTPVVGGTVDKRNSDLEMSKGDMSSSSHYHRFKRNSLGYQSQRPQIYGNIQKENPLIKVDPDGGQMQREASQTAFGVGQFPQNGRNKAPASVLINNQDAVIVEQGGNVDLNSSLGIGNPLSAVSSAPDNNNQPPFNSNPIVNHKSPADRFRRNLNLNMVSEEE